MVTLVFLYFQVNNIAISNLEKAYASVKSEQQSWSSLIIHIQRFFALVKNAEYSVFFVLDEFDHARALFKNDPNAFQALRDLAYRNFGVNYLITSRRTIREIEVQSTAISTFDGIISKHYVSLFMEDEIGEYYKRLENLGLALSDEHKAQIQYYCGRHPYLLAALGYEIVEDFKKDEEIFIDAIFSSRVELNFLQYYKQLIHLLKEDRTFGKLLQILFGPYLNVSGDNNKELKNYYGLIEEFDLADNDKGLKAFSMHFQDYLRISESA